MESSNSVRKAASAFRNQRPFCLHRGQPTSPDANGRRASETEHHACRDAQIILGLCAARCFRKARQEIIDLDGSNREVMSHSVVHAAAEGHGEGVVRTGDGRCTARKAAAGVRHAEQDLSKRRDPPEMPIGNARAEEIPEKRAIYVRAQNVSIVIAAEIGDSTEPTVDVICDGSAAAVKVETAAARSAGTIANVGIARKISTFGTS